MVPIARGAPVPVRRPHTASAAKPTAAAYDMAGARFRTTWIKLRRCWIFAIHVTAPFPNIALHLIQPSTSSRAMISRLQCSHGTRPCAISIGRIPVVVHLTRADRVSKAERCRRASTTCILPLGFCRKTGIQSRDRLIQSLQKLGHLIKAHLFHRTVITFECAWVILCHGSP